MIIRLPGILLAGAVLLFAAETASAAGDVAAGRGLAKQWCSSCHLVEGDGRGSGSDAAPPFAVLARDPAKTEAYLRSWIANPHPPMPDFNIGRRDAADLAAYIRSLRERPGALPRGR